jgi:hypothetical protein
MTPLSEVWPISDGMSEDISIYDGPEVFLADFGNLPRAHQVAFAAGWFQGEVLNGGLTQFFANDTGVLAPEAVEACRTVGMLRLAGKLAEAMSWFGTAYPRDRGTRKQALEQYALLHRGTSIYHTNPFNKLDDEIVELLYDENAGLEEAALSYVREHGG